MRFDFLQTIYLFFLITIFSHIIFFIGCNQGRVRPPGLPKLYQCTINLTQQGVPLSGASVLLQPLSPVQDRTWTVSGFSDETGKVEIYTNGYFRGAPRGNFKVIITKTETITPPFPDVMPTDPRERAKLENMIENETKVYKVVADKFSKAETTPFELEIKGNTEQIFDVGGVVKKKIPN
ncbi:MAG: hypothetical protein LBU34_03045 [Planctomycetaceae bacterium]|jgi:hypothetical protein|nr:hypothetical protein [Planctomycetaceae bacterium]